MQRSPRVLRKAKIRKYKENAKHSTGPTSAAGSERSSQNARKHGLTGQTLFISPQEAGPYALHVEGYMERFDRLSTYLSRQLATLGTYEGRKRRASVAIKAELDEIDKEILSQQEATAPKSQKTNAQPEIGFVCTEIDEHQEPVSAYQALEGAMRQLEVTNGILPEKTPNF